MRSFRFQVGVVWLLLAAGVVGALAGSGHAARAGPERTAKAPAVVVRDFRWLGFAKDMVGPTDARPNGERDGHFSVVIAASRRAQAISSVSLWSCVKDGCPTPFATTMYSWLTKKSTAPLKGMWTVLGVSVAGRRHPIDGRNKASWLRLPVSKKGVRLDLYVNDGPGCLPIPKSQEPSSCAQRFVDHRLGPHERFQLTLTVNGKQLDLALGNGRHALRSAWLRTPGQEPSVKQPIELGTFRYVGLDRDVAGSTYGSPPDGKPEAHFRLDLTAARGPGYLWNVVLTRAPVGGWSNTLPAPLTVFLDGTKLDLTPAKGPYEESGSDTWVDLRWSSTPQRLDLYAYDNSHHAGDPTWEPFAPGSRFTAMVFVLLPHYVLREGPGYVETSTTVPGG